MSSEASTGASSTRRLEEHAAATAKKGKQLTRRQIRLMVPIQLEIDNKDPNVTVEYIDALFDDFDEDNSNTIDDA
eukprot:COSAG02_NODE_19404_length_883_cov_3.879837_1_plen_74_part_01